MEQQTVGRWNSESIMLSPGGAPGSSRFENGWNPRSRLTAGGTLGSAGEAGRTLHGSSRWSLGSSRLKAEVGKVTLKTM